MTKVWAFTGKQRLTSRRQTGSWARQKNVLKSRCDNFTATLHVTRKITLRVRKCDMGTVLQRRYQSSGESAAQSDKNGP